MTAPENSPLTLDEAARRRFEVAAWDARQVLGDQTKAPAEAKAPGEKNAQAKAGQPKAGEKTAEAKAGQPKNTPPQQKAQAKATPKSEQPKTASAKDAPAQCHGV